MPPHMWRVSGVEKERSKVLRTGVKVKMAEDPNSISRIHMVE